MCACTRCPVPLPLLSNDYEVPQDSTLGPFPFLLYINDLPSSVHCTPRLFADDTCLLFSAPNRSKLGFDVKKDLNDIYEWFAANKLTNTVILSNLMC